jgi:hypothetical protein
MNIQDTENLSPVIHCFAKCFLCKRLIAIKRDENGEIALGERDCPHCGVFLDESQIATSLAQNFWHTAAITSANKLLAFDLAVIPFLLCGLLAAFVGYPIWFRLVFLVPYFGMIVILWKWMYRYWYRIRFDDEEYLEAFRGIKRSLQLWIFTNLLCWLMLLF